MIKQIAWETFKNTGNIDTFMELMQVEDAEKNIEEMNKHGNNQIQRNYNCRKTME